MSTRASKETFGSTRKESSPHLALLCLQWGKNHQQSSWLSLVGPHSIPTELCQRLMPQKVKKWPSMPFSHWVRLQLALEKQAFTASQQLNVREAFNNKIKKNGPFQNHKHMVQKQSLNFGLLYTASLGIRCNHADEALWTFGKEGSESFQQLPERVWVRGLVSSKLAVEMEDMRRRRCFRMCDELAWVIMIRSCPLVNIPSHCTNAPVCAAIQNRLKF